MHFDLQRRYKSHFYAHKLLFYNERIQLHYVVGIVRNDETDAGRVHSDENLVFVWRRETGSLDL